MPQSLIQCDSKSVVIGSTVPMNLGTLTNGKRVREMQLLFSLTYTKDAADALDGDLFAQCVQNVRIGQYVNIQGFALWRYLQYRYGRIMNDPTDIPGSGTSGTIEFTLTIPFRDHRRPGSDDGSLPCELLKAEHACHVTFAAGTVHGVGSLTFTGGTVRLLAEEVHETHVPVITQLASWSPGGQTFEVPAGVYSDLFILDGTGTSTITKAEITSVHMAGDADITLANAAHEQLVYLWNRQVPVDSAAEIASNAARFLPLIWSEQGGKGNLTKQPGYEGKAQVQIAGTMTAPLVVYCRAAFKDQSQVQELAEVLQAPRSAREYEPQTATKSHLRAFDASARKGSPTRKARLAAKVLPGKFRTTKTPRGAA